MGISGDGGRTVGGEGTGVAGDNALRWEEYCKNVRRAKGRRCRIICEKMSMVNNHRLFFTNY